MTEKCRLCLTENSFLTHTSSIREGLPISVLIMIICPVKIETSDSLPKQICEECLETVLSAYKLRDVSSQTERFLHNHLREDLVVESELDALVMKNEKVFSEDNFSVSNSIFFDSLQPEDSPSEQFYVNCYKDTEASVTANSKSLAWKYMGALCNAVDEEIDSDFLYCSLCVAKQNFQKYKKSVSTTCLLNHLSQMHSVGSMSPETTQVDHILCDICGQHYSSKLLMSNHMKQFHTNDLHDDSVFKVLCYKQKRFANSSIVWEYFGLLVDAKGNELDLGRNYHYCKLCVEQNHSLKTRFTMGSSTSSLMSHLKIKHGIFTDAMDDKIDETISMSNIIKKDIDDDSNEVTYNSSGFGVNCYKASANRSFAWNYIGILVDREGPIESEAQNWFCRICVQQGSVTKKFRKSSATTNFLFHLKASHKITELSSSNQSFMKDHQKGDRNTKCTLCNESFESRKAYFNHIRIQHESAAEATNFICHVCSKAFAKHYVLKKHMKIHDGENYRCSVCPATFTYIGGLKRHESVHDPAHYSRYQCDKCSNSYAEMKSLKNHILTVHMKKSAERKHQCSFCEMKFSKAGVLRRHLMIHTGEKPHQCTYCETAYTQKGDLLKHLQKSHVGNALYDCTIENCTASFRLQVELREHYRVHFQGQE